MEDDTKEERKLKVLRQIQLKVEKILGSKCPDIEIKLPKGIVQSRTSILFEPDSDRVEKTTRDLISQLSHALNTIEKAYNEHRDAFEHHILFEVAGHTHAPPNVDPVGTLSIDVSSRRAKRIKKELENRGINPKILTSKGYGGSQPKDILRPELNRRVELRLLDHDIAFPWCRSEETPPLLLRPTASSQSHNHHRTHTPSKVHLTRSRENMLQFDRVSQNLSKTFPSIEFLKPLRGHAAASKLQLTVTPSLTVPPEITHHHFTPHALPHVYTPKSIPSEREHYVSFDKPLLDIRSKSKVKILNVPQLLQHLRPRSPISHDILSAEPQLVDIPELMSLVPDSSHIKYHASLPTKEMCCKLSEVFEEKAGVPFAPSPATAPLSGLRRYERIPVPVITRKSTISFNKENREEEEFDRISNLNIWAARQSELWAGIARLQRQMAERDKSRFTRIEDRMSRISTKLEALMKRIRRGEKNCC